MNIEPIGIVKSPATEAVDNDWGKVTSEIHIDTRWAKGLAGLGQF